MPIVMDAMNVTIRQMMHPPKRDILFNCVVCSDNQYRETVLYTYISKNNARYGIGARLDHLTTMGGCCSNRKLLKEATRYLLKYSYNRHNVDSKEVWDIVRKHPTASINELIRIFFQDKHTFHDPDTTPMTIDRFPKPWVRIKKTQAKIIVELGPFVGLFRDTVYQHRYENKTQHVISHPERYAKKKWLVIDLRQNDGGDEKIMYEALKGIEKWIHIPNKVVRVGAQTASAGEMVAAWLIYDLGFKRGTGPKTAGMLSVAKNVVLCDGSFLSIRTTQKYVTPGGHVVETIFI